MAAIVLYTLPVRHTEAQAKRFQWSRIVQISTRSWVKKKSKQEPSGEIRNLVIKHANEPEQRSYRYEEAKWHKSRKPTKSGYGQSNLEWPAYTLRKDEKVHWRREVYQATFAAEAGRHYTKTLGFERWQTLRTDQRYRLGRNVFGRVRTIRPAPPPATPVRSREDSSGKPQPSPRRGFYAPIDPGDREG
ncbi:MAG: hypothetical protein JO016_15290 [Actinobacteria bacterium]|nr:hypothetical protein [Actinomycetota bacterium]